MSGHAKSAGSALMIGLSLLAASFGFRARAQAQTPLASGLIAFAGQGAERGIWTIDPVSSGLTRLTHGQDYRPRWSPDGSKILFQRFSFAVSLQSVWGAFIRITRFTGPLSPSRVGCRVDLTGLSRMPDALAPGLPGGRRPESLRLKSRLIVPGMDAGAPVATSRGRAVDQPPQMGRKPGPQPAKTRRSAL